MVSTNCVVDIDSVTKTFGSVTAVSDLTLSVPEGSICGFIGPNGSGKSIIHADDLGVSHSENIASIKAMEEGAVNSASIMVPCPWFPEIATYAKSHPEMDFGLHLTLTSEWKYYKWRPLTSYSEVKGLVDENNFFHEGWTGVRENASAQEVEKELRAQVEMAKKFGINITHLDSHMFSVFSKPKYVEVYKKLQ